MPSRSVRRKKHKKLQRLPTLEERRRLEWARNLLCSLSAEAKHRAKRMDSKTPSVWALVRDPHIRKLAIELDETGQLLAELQQVCAEAIAATVDFRMAGGRKPYSKHALERVKK